MALIKDALSALPAKPALFIAPILVVLVLSLYYRDRYQQCVDIKNSRVALQQYLLALDAPASFRLADFTDFAWNKVRIVASVRPDSISNTCPLDWNWASGERDDLIAAGRLTAMIFGQQGQIVKYLELRGDEVEFRGAEGNLTPQDAVFSVEPRPGAADGFRLTLQN